MNNEIRSKRELFPLDKEIPSSLEKITFALG